MGFSVHFPQRIFYVPPSYTTSNFASYVKPHPQQQWLSQANLNKQRDFQFLREIISEQENLPLTVALLLFHNKSYEALAHEVQNSILIFPLQQANGQMLLISCQFDKNVQSIRS